MTPPGLRPKRWRRITDNFLVVPGLGLLHHSDQGSTYASDDYQDVLSAYGITCSISAGYRDQKSR